MRGWGRVFMFLITTSSKLKNIYFAHTCTSLSGNLSKGYKRTLEKVSRASKGTC